MVSFCENLANAGKVVIVAALDGTFQRRGFPSILELVPLAEHVVKLNAVCMSCFGEGSYTKRMSQDKEVMEQLTTRRPRLSPSLSLYIINTTVRGDRGRGDVHGRVPPLLPLALLRPGQPQDRTPQGDQRPHQRQRQGGQVLQLSATIRCFFRPQNEDEPPVKKALFDEEAGQQQKENVLMEVAANGTN